MFHLVRLCGEIDNLCEKTHLFDWHIDFFSMVAHWFETPDELYDSTKLGKRLSVPGCIIRYQCYNIDGESQGEQIAVILECKSDISKEKASPCLCEAHILGSSDEYYAYWQS